MSRTESNFQMLCFKLIYQYLGAKSSLSLLVQIEVCWRLSSGLTLRHISHPLDINMSAKLLQVKYVYLSLQDEGFELWMKLSKVFCHQRVSQLCFKYQKWSNWQHMLIAENFVLYIDLKNILSQWCKQCRKDTKIFQLYAILQSFLGSLLLLIYNSLEIGEVYPVDLLIDPEPESHQWQVVIRQGVGEWVWCSARAH